MTDKPFGNAQPEGVDNYHFDYIKPDGETFTHLENCREAYKGLLNQLHTIPASRERALAITHLETSLMYATKSIVVASKP